MDITQFALTNSLTKQLDFSIDNRALWNPPTQPSCIWGDNNIPTTKDPELNINATYEELRTFDPTYITRTVLGKDQSDTYNIYKYVFQPKHYTKTMIFSAGTHGNEYTTFFALWRFMHHVTHDWKDHPQLAYIRRNVRIIVLPMINPWGFANNKRQNKNLVDLNRNTDYLWTYLTATSSQVGGTYYKGTAPFSEKESQYVRDVLIQYQEALAYQDLHCIVSNDAEHIAYTSRYLPIYQDVFDDVIDMRWQAGDKLVRGTSAVPTFHCYAAANFHMTSANPEWHDGKYGPARGSAEMTKCMEFMGNVLINSCRLQFKTNVLENTEPWTKLFMYDKTGTNANKVTTLNTFTNVAHTAYDIKINRHGILRASGYFKFTLSAPATVTINPFIYQSYHPDMSFTDTKDALYNSIKLTLPAGTHVVPINSRYHAVPSNYNTGSINRTSEAKFRIRVNIDAGELTTESFRIYLDYTPSRRGMAYEIYDCTGKETTTDNTTEYTKLYPDPAKYNDGNDDE